MVTYYSAGTGNWSNAAIWDTTSGGPGGDGVPGTGDEAHIETGNTVTIDSAITIHKIWMDGGALAINSNITFNDTSLAQIVINATQTNTITNNGTYASPRLLSSASTYPTHPWRIYVYDVASSSYDTRSIDLDYCTLTGNRWTLMNDTYYMVLNSTSSMYITNITPLVRQPKLEEHFCEGRDYSRIYHMGAHPGTLTISGWGKWSSLYHVFIKKAKDSGERLSFTAQYIHLNACRIESVRYRPRPGSLYYDFEITLVEDK